MIFNSKEFLIFLFIIFPLFILSKSWLRKLLLVIASYYFYSHFDPLLFTLLFLVSSLCFFSSKKIEETEGFAKTLLASLSLILVFIPLVYFKYLNFLSQNLNKIYDFNFDFGHIALPIGISFFTFQAVGYLIDVINKKIKASNSFLDFLLFVSFFPQLVAGPIERAKDLLPQIQKLSLKYDYQNIVSAFKLIAWGLFKKVVIADKLAKVVDPVYDQFQSYNSMILIVVTIFFGYQIYCDFSGYSDMAKGIAKLFGIDLRINFLQPYLSKSIPEFWSRWHISLSTWFKDYVFIPMGGSRVLAKRLAFNIIVVFLVSGLWHGANWTFIFWGLVHAIFYLLSKYLKIDTWNLPNILKITITFFIVNFAWIFFRSETIADSFEILKIMFTKFSFAAINFNYQVLPLLLLLIVVMEGLSFKRTEMGYPKLLDHENVYIRWLFYYLLLGAIIVLGEFNQSPFIYFQF